MEPWILYSLYTIAITAGALLAGVLGQRIYQLARTTLLLNRLTTPGFGTDPWVGLHNRLGQPPAAPDQSPDGHDEIEIRRLTAERILQERLALWEREQALITQLVDHSLPLLEWQRLLTYKAEFNQQRARLVNAFNQALADWQLSTRRLQLATIADGY